MSHGAAPLIAARALRKAYGLGEQSVEVLHGLDFEIAAGEFVAIMGPSGSGKSTLMNLIGALDQPSSGSLLIDGVDIATQGRDALAQLRNRTIGFVFQNFNLLARTTALENVKLPLLYQDPRPVDPEAMAREKLVAVGLGDRMLHVPSQLSGGQQQRVAIARALVGRPRLLLADEPTGALDSQTSLEVMQQLDVLNAEGLTIVLVTHEAEVAAHARRQIRLRDGRIAEDRLRESGSFS